MRRFFLLSGLLCLAIGGFWYFGYRASGGKTSESTEPTEKRGDAPLEAVQPPSGPVVQAPALAFLNDLSRPPLEDVRLLEGLLGDYLQLSKGNRRPLGLNEDIVLALTEGGRFGVRFMSPQHPAIEEGVLLDRWDQPYHFHALAADEFEVRSAGPDRTLFTDDDIVSERNEDAD